MGFLKSTWRKVSLTLLFTLLLLSFTPSIFVGMTGCLGIGAFCPHIEGITLIAYLSTFIWGDPQNGVPYHIWLQHGFPIHLEKEWLPLLLFVPLSYCLSCTIVLLLKLFSEQKKAK